MAPRHAGPRLAGSAGELASLRAERPGGPTAGEPGHEAMGVTRGEVASPRSFGDIDAARRLPPTGGSEGAAPAGMSLAQKPLPPSCPVRCPGAFE